MFKAYDDLKLGDTFETEYEYIIFMYSNIDPGKPAAEVSQT